MRTWMLVLLLVICGMCCAAQEIVCFEAEGAGRVSAPMQVGSDDAKATSKWPPAKGASGAKCLEVPEGQGKPPEVTTGEATCTFQIAQAGPYILWGRVWWLDECGNSLTM